MKKLGKRILKKQKLAKSLLKAQRIRFEEEKKIPWLSPLLEAYYVADKGICQEINRRLKLGESLACRKGCSNCCHTHFTIPVYPYEIIGIYWFSIEKLTGSARDIVKKQLAQFKEKSPCPFLVNGACAIHPVRPLACRLFNVFNTPCKPGEDPYYCRRKDVLTPDEKTKNRAVSMILSLSAPKEFLKRNRKNLTGIMNQFAQNMHEIQWKNLALRMDGHKPPTGPKF